MDFVTWEFHDELVSINCLLDRAGYTTCRSIGFVIYSISYKIYIRVCCILFVVIIVYAYMYFFYSCIFLRVAWLALDQIYDCHCVCDVTTVDDMAKIDKNQTTSNTAKREACS